jgi:hypothetical protein
MSLKDVLAGQGKRLVQSPTVLRLMSEDRVMRAFEGLIDGRNRANAGSVGLGWVGVKGAPGGGDQADPSVVTPCTRLVHTLAPRALLPALRPSRPLAP